MSIHDKLTEFFNAKLDLSDKDSDQFKEHIKRLLEYGIDTINFAKYDEPPIEVINGDAFMVPDVKPQKLIMVKISDILDNYKTPGYLSNLMNPYEK